MQNLDAIQKACKAAFIYGNLLDTLFINTTAAIAIKARQASLVIEVLSHHKQLILFFDF